MKQRILTIVALATVLGLLVAGTTAAGGNRTSFTGTSAFVAEPDWPERSWVPGRNVAFWRGMPFLFAMTTTNLRVNGMACISHNGNYRPSPDDPWAGVRGQMWGEIRIESDYDLDCTNSTNYWEETFVGDRAPDGSEHLRYNLKDYGAYAGLQLRFEEWSDPIDPNNRPFTVAGEMLDPGKKK